MLRPIPFSAPVLGSLILVIGLLDCATLHAEPPYRGQGDMAGEVTSDSVLLQTRLTEVPGPSLSESGDIPGCSGVVTFEVALTASFETSSKTALITAKSEHDYIARTLIKDLKPATTYFYRSWIGKDKSNISPGPTRSFKTLPSEDQPTNVSFCMGSCMNYNTFVNGVANGGGPITATEEDRELGYPSFAAMTQLKPDFFIGTGDIVYYDNPSKGAAQTLPELRRKWHQQFRFPRLVEFFNSAPAYWSKDDHDFRFNDADLLGQRLPNAKTGIDLFREQMPILAAEDSETPTFRTHRIGHDLQLWFTEGRDYRSPNKMPDGPDKSLWGKEQRDWLKESLQHSTATWKIIISPTPMVGPDDKSKKDNHANLAGFRHEADAFFQWVREEEIGKLLIFCGDRHWQYHSIHPSGVEEFGCGALNDENSRRGVAPGSARGTDPEGLINQPYTYPEPTGGFLHITAGRESTETHAQTKLTIKFYDDHGKLLHQEVKRSNVTR